MARTSEAEVRGVIETDENVDISNFISNAGVITDRIETLSSASGNTLTSQELQLIETYLAAHLYALKDRQYESKRTGKASSKFQGKTGMGLDSTVWGQTALAIDWTGNLATVTGSSSGGAKSVSVAWGGSE